MAFAEPAHFARAADAVGTLLVGVTPDQWAAPTACAQWNVAQVVDHLVEVNHRFAAELGAAGVSTPYAEAFVDGYRRSTKALLDALRGAESGEVLPTQLRARLALRVADLIVHGWDVATATGRPLRLPDDLTAHALALVQSRIGALRRSGQFADPQPVDDSAPAIDRLAALSGRALVRGSVAC